MSQLTDELIDRFADALRTKLEAAERKYGFKDEWLYNDWEQDCRRDLLAHLAKGDPRDVAIYCAFMWHHGWSTCDTEQQVPNQPLN